ncbi:hypothetical protein DIPPA_09668 [Diplonema papillatum]|nr:hypothetical protein DIPPA_09668 [Diplonema papillatum]
MGSCCSDNADEPDEPLRAGRRSQSSGGRAQRGYEAKGGRQLGGEDRDGDARANAAKAAIERVAEAKHPPGISAGTADKMREKRERDELRAKIENMAYRLKEEVPLAVRGKETPLPKLRSYKDHLEQKLREKGLD